MKGHCFIEEADKSRSTQGSTHGCWTAMIPENHCNIIVFGKTQCCSNTPPQYCTCHRLPRGRGPQADVGTLLIVYFKVLVFPHLWGILFLESPQYLAKSSTQLDLKMHFRTLFWFLEQLANYQTLHSDENWNWASQSQHRKWSSLLYLLVHNIPCFDKISWPWKEVSIIKTLQDVPLGKSSISFSTSLKTK